MRNARRSRFQFRKKPLPSPARGGDTPDRTAASPAEPSKQSKTTVVLLVAGVILACLLVGFSLSAVIEQGRLAARITTLQKDTTQLQQDQEKSLARVEQALQGLATSQADVDKSLQTIVDGENQLSTQVAALETARAADSTQNQQTLAALQKTTSDGLSQIATRLDGQDSLSASVRQLVPLLKPGESTQTDSGTTGTTSSAP